MQNESEKNYREKHKSPRPHFGGQDNLSYNLSWEIRRHTTVLDTAWSRSVGLVFN